MVSTILTPVLQSETLYEVCRNPAMNAFFTKRCCFYFETIRGVDFEFVETENVFKFDTIMHYCTLLICKKQENSIYKSIIREPLPIKK